MGVSTVSLSKNKMFYFSISNSKGCPATVDGETIKILRGNRMFMCLPMTAGYHEIESRYRLPELKLGVTVSVVSLGVLY